MAFWLVTLKFLPPLEDFIFEWLSVFFILLITMDRVMILMSYYLNQELWYMAFWFFVPLKFLLPSVLYSKKFLCGLIFYIIIGIVKAFYCFLLGSLYFSCSTINVWPSPVSLLMFVGDLFFSILEVWPMGSFSF